MANARGCWLFLLRLAGALAMCAALAGCGPITSGALATAVPAIVTAASEPHGPSLTALAPAPLPTARPPTTEPAPTAPTSTALPAGGPPRGAVRATLVKVIDGDTIDVNIGGRTERVRYVGIDTPERGQPGYKAATQANRELLGSGPLYLVRDVSDRDKTSSHRLLRYVYRADGTLVEAELVARGWAQPVEYPPDTRLAAEYLRLAVQAAQQKLGFWSTTPPSDGAMPYALTTRGAEVRKGPGPAFAVNKRLEEDTPLTVYGRTPQGDWLQVRTPTRAGGWIVASAVQLNVPVDQVPIPDKIPSS